MPIDSYQATSSCSDFCATRDEGMQGWKRRSAALDQRNNVRALRVGAGVQAGRLELIQLPQQTQLELCANTQ